MAGFDAKAKMRKRPSSAGKASSYIFSVPGDNRRLQKRASSTGKLNVEARASKRLTLRAALDTRRSAPKGLGESSLDSLKEALASCQDIEMDADIQATHMLRYQELKFKSCLPKLSEVLSDAEARMPSKLSQGYKFSGLKELTEAGEQFKTSQQSVFEAGSVDMARLVSKNKPEFQVKDQDRSQQLIGFDGKSQISQGCNYMTFRKRFHRIRDKISDGANANQAREWQQELRPDVTLPTLCSNRRLLL